MINNSNQLAFISAIRSSRTMIQIRYEETIVDQLSPTSTTKQLFLFMAKLKYETLSHKNSTTGINCMTWTHYNYQYSKTALIDVHPQFQYSFSSYPLSIVLGNFGV